MFAKPLLATAAVLALTVGSVQAAPMTSPDLIAACGGDQVGKASCNGYLQALTDLVPRREGHGKTGKICMPDTTTADQVRDAVVGFAAQHKGGRAPFALGLVNAPMRTTWPCDGAAKAQ